MIFAKKSTSDTILIGAFPAAKKAGEGCVFGSLKGFATLNTEAGQQGTVNVGKEIAVFQIPKTGITANIGTDVYITSTGTLSSAPAGNTLFGTVTVIGSDTYDIAITG
jgi:predicted RecA/RadA family phage recombinase